MISSEVQRTLVKSPPELWAELSDADALTRHLGALGDIRITRSEPEKLVEWEADGASGSVQIKPSGWGTKVTLSVNRELAASAPAAGAAPDPAPRSAEDDAAVASEPEAEDDEDETPLAESDDPIEAHEPEIHDVEEIATAELDEPATDTEWDAGKTIAFEALQEPALAAESRRGFFARLFGRLRARNEADARPAELPHDHEPAESDEAPSEEGAAEEPLAEDTPAQAQPDPPGSAIESLQARFAPAGPPAEEPFEAPFESAEEVAEPIAEEPAEPGGEQAAQELSEPPAEPSAGLAAELRAAEEVAAEEVTAMLTAVLDRLGAAHHRPFSRS